VDRTTLLIAKRIVDLAKEGECDPERLTAARTCVCGINRNLCVRNGPHCLGGGRGTVIQHPPSPSGHARRRPESLAPVLLDFHCPLDPFGIRSDQHQRRCGSSDRARDWLHEHRIQALCQVAGAAQGDCSAGDAGRGPAYSQPGNRPIWPDCCAVLWGRAHAYYHPRDR
jgi:hypothetical protein